MRSFEEFEREFFDDAEALVEALNLSDIDDLWYKNEPKIPRSQLDISAIINEDRIVELQKCANDLFYFVENYIYIQHPDHGTIPFKLRSFQHEMLENFLAERFVLVKIGRQLGKTTVVLAYFLWCLLFNKNFSILMFANEDDLAKGNLTTMKLMYERLPLWMKDGVKKWNEKEIKFESGSFIKSRVARKSSGRGSTNNILYMDEIGIIDDSIMVPWKKSALPTIESGKTTKFFATSTPKGMNTFWQMFTEGLAGLNSFKCLSYPWDVDGIRGEDFKKHIIETEGMATWRQEYMALFIGTSGTLIDAEVLERLTKISPIKEVMVMGRFPLKIYKEYNPKSNYIMVHDPSEGLGGETDSTAINVIEVVSPTVYEQVATLKDNTIDDEDAPFVLLAIGTLYGGCVEISENNFLPQIPKVLFYNLNYENVWSNPADGRYGIKMTSSVRKKALSSMKRNFRQGRIIIHDSDTIFELMTFSKKGDRYEAETGRHDDLVMSLAIFFWFISDELRFEDFFEDFFDIDVDYFKDVRGIPMNDEGLPDIMIDGAGGIHRMGTHDNQRHR